MKGTIVAINRQLGAVVAETPDHKCVVLETLGRLNADVGDQIEGDWADPGAKLIDNITRGGQMQMNLQDNNITRSEAVGRMTVL